MNKFAVKSDPVQADVVYVNPQTGERKSIGKTPLELPAADLKNTLGDAVTSGEYFTIQVEKPGYKTESFSIPASKFGTMITTLDVKMKTSNDAVEERLARTVLDHLFLAQKFALMNQYERAQIEIDKVLASFPQFPRALSMRASIYFAQKNYAESLKWYDEALKADPQLEDAARMEAKVRVLAGNGRLPAGATLAPPTPVAPAPAPAPAPGTQPAPGGQK